MAKPQQNLYFHSSACLFPSLRIGAISLVVPSRGHICHLNTLAFHNGYHIWYVRHFRISVTSVFRHIEITTIMEVSLQWRHNGRDSVFNHQPHDCLLNRYSDADKKNIKAQRHWPLCGEFTGDRWIPAQMASNAENVSIWCRHHGFILTKMIRLVCRVDVLLGYSGFRKLVATVAHNIIRQMVVIRYRLMNVATRVMVVAILFQTYPWYLVHFCQDTLLDVPRKGANGMSYVS